MATKYAVYHAGDPLASSADTDGFLALGHIINISPDHADMAEIKGYACLYIAKVTGRRCVVCKCRRQIDCKVHYSIQLLY